MARLIRWSFVALVLLSTGCGDRRAGPGVDGGSFGAPCGEGSDCATGICVVTAPGEGRCSAGCTSDDMCPPDWRCLDVAGTQACTCTGSAETCNGIDDDCDTRTDEGTGAEIGCGTGEVCAGATCQCPAASVCGGSCVDTQTDPQHCGACGNVCPSGACASGRCCELTSRARAMLDLLIVIDNSNSMTEEQLSLANEVPRLVDVLTTGDLNGDGDNGDPGDFAPITDIHVGVVTTDMGTGGFTVPTCARSDFGDDGVLRTGSCASSPPSFLEYGAGDPASAFAADVECVVSTGTGGCGFEQQLEAMLKALSPAAPTAWTASGYTPPTFHAGTSGHGDGANAGFLRADSTLAVLMLTDEEDCSASDPELFNGPSSTYTASLNLRCFEYETEALHPVSRFVEGLLSLRPSPSDVVFVPIAGIPVDLAAEPGAPTDFDRLVGPEDVRDPRMIPTIDRSMPTQLIPSCNGSRGVAFAPVRIARVARGIMEGGGGASVQSICQASLRSPIDAFLLTLTGPRLVCE